MMKTSNARQNFLWNLLGSLSTAAVSVLLLMVVSRLLSRNEADVFAFSYSLGHLLLVIGWFQMRNYQATDIKEKYSFPDYFQSRLLTCGLMIVAAVIYLVWQQFDAYKATIILLVALYRMTDAFSDVFQGFFQQKERLDLAGKSLFFRNILVFLVFTGTLILTNNLTVALVLVCLVSSIFIVFYDIRYSFQMERWMHPSDKKGSPFSSALVLLKEVFPFFINGFLLNYIYNSPKYALDSQLELGKVAEGVQTDFNILFMPAFVMNLLMLFFRPMITQMAIYYFNDEQEKFKRLQYKILLFLAGASLVVLVGAWLLGIPVLNLLYGVKLDHYQSVLMLLMLGGVLSSFATAFDNILTVLRKQNLLLVSYILAFTCSLLVTSPLVSHYAIFGAGLAYVVTMAVWLISSLALYLYTKRK